ncbi:3',5'-cyclic-AMP phosphodiesterase [Acinetobacter sp. CFCC 10889]|uniref:3',5'-cyclic-AMP phosphodiesterase n=1 Tax=Acinetobacter sp. CFCC 10889 TaxID=1775557 RepID=UPI000DCFF291|nr:3',5'-cyclic-AMP phosphodiesterase [Acinetobacter sp. CFCC 10889]
MSKYKIISKRQDHVIIQITDTHLMTDPNESFIGIFPEQNFHAVIAQILQEHPRIDAIVHTGDLAQQATTETYQRYQNYMRSLGIPFFQIPGNHDDINLFPFLVPNPKPACVEIGDWCIILLNSAVPHKVDGWIQAEQLNHLENLLTRIQDKFVILACHHHPVDMHSDWIDQHKLKNTEHLTNVLSQFTNIKAVLFGHVHQESLTVWENIQFLSTPATCAQFKPLSKNFALDDTAPGYRYLHLKSDGQFESTVFRLKDYNKIINDEISGY